MLSKCYQDYRAAKYRLDSAMEICEQLNAEDPMMQEHKARIVSGAKINSVPRIGLADHAT